MKGMLNMDRVSDSRWFPEIPGEEMQFAGEKSMDKNVEIRKMNINNTKLRKGEIMKRARNSFFMGSWSVMVFLLAMSVLLVGSTGANAQVVQQNPAAWTAVIQSVSSPGVALQGRSIGDVTAGAILGATDASSKGGKEGAVYGNNRPGKIFPDIQYGTMINSNSTKDSLNLSSGPIIANIIPNSNMFFAVVIEGVSNEVVQHIVNDRSSLKDITSATAQSVISSVTARFPASLFKATGNNTTVANAIAVSGLSPNGVTGALPAWAGGSVASVSRQLVLIWEYSDLIVSATDPTKVSTNIGNAVGENDLRATVNVLGKELAKSNYVGVEIPGLTGPKILNNYTVNRAIDTTSTLVSYGWQSNQVIYGNTNGTLYSDSNPKFKEFQFRSGDIIETTAVILHRKDLTGEPKAYFTGTFDVLDGKEGIVIESKDSGLTTVGLNYWKSGSPVDLIDIVAVKGGQPVFSKVEVAFAAGPADSQTIMYVTGTVSKNLLTFGEYETGSIQYNFRDEVESATNESTNILLDTAPPYVSTISSVGRLGGNDTGFPSTPDGGFVRTTLDVEPGGEVNTDPAKWLDVEVEDVGYKWDWSGSSVHWSSAGSVNIGNKVAVANANVTASSSPVFVNGIAPNNDDINLTRGSRVVIDMPANLGANVMNAGLIFNVSDDARNPAIVFYGSEANAKGAPDTWDNDISAVRLSAGSANSSNTINKMFSVVNAEIGLYRQIANATTAIDNASPRVLDVTFAVTNFPSEFFKGSTSDQLYDSFSYLKKAYDTINNGYSAQSSWAFINTVSREQIFVDRGTAAIASNSVANVSGTGAGYYGPQNGSPLVAIVKFELSTSFDDPDILIAADKIPSRIRLNPTSKDGATDIIDSWKDKDTVLTSSTFNQEFEKKGWSLTAYSVGLDNSLLPASPAQVGYATFALSGGLPALYDNKSRQLALTLDIWDRYKNYDNAPTANTSNPIIVDVSRPVAEIPYPKDPLMMTLVSGNSEPATYALMIVTDADGYQTFSKKDDGGYTVPAIVQKADLNKLTKAGANLISFVTDTKPFLNSNNSNYPPSQAGGVKMASGFVDVKAGYMVIVSATFTEQNSMNSDYTTMDGDSTNKLYFPYVIGALSQTVKLDADTSTSVLAQKFRTVAADFSDFNQNAKAVLPDVTKFVTLAGAPATASAASGDVVEATWFYYINGADTDNPLNPMSASTIRCVTLTARDLSGNITKRQVPVGTANFTKATPAIVAWRVFNDIGKNTMANGAAVDGLAYYQSLNSSITSAVAINAATFNLKTSKLQVVVQVGDSNAGSGELNAGGGLPESTSGFLTVDFSPFGGDAAATTKDWKVYPTTATKTSASTIVVATFEYSASADGGNKIAEADLKKIKAKVTTINLVTTPGESATGIQVDRAIPGYVKINENESADYVYVIEKPVVSSDKANDLLLRPGEPIQVYARVKGDINTPKYPTVVDGKGTYGDMQVTANLSSIGGGSAVTPTSFDKYISGSTFIYDVTWETSVVSTASSLATITVSATDAARNLSTKDSQQHMIDKSAPVVNSIVLSATSAINFVTDGIRQTYVNNSKVYKFTEIGKKIGETGAPTYNFGLNSSDKNTSAVLGNGSFIQVVGSFSTKDSADIPNVWADFTLINPSVGKITPTSGKTSAGMITTATWVVPVSSSAASAEVVWVTLSGQSTFSSVISADVISPYFTLDTTAPQQAEGSYVKYWYKGDPSITLLGKKIGDNQVDVLVDDVTATMKFVVDLSDDQKYSENGRKRYAGTFINAIAKLAGSSGQINDITYNAFTINEATALFTINGSDFGFTNPIEPDGWSLTGNGVKNSFFVSSGGIKKVDHTKSTGALENVSLSWPGVKELFDSTATILTVSVERNTDSNRSNWGLKINVPSLDTSKSKADAAFVLQVTDHIGNFANIKPNTVFLDVSAPVVSSVTMVPAADQVEGKDYIKALYTAGGEIVRPTRITKNTKMIALSKFTDKPLLTVDLIRSFNLYNVGTDTSGIGLPFNPEASNDNLKFTTTAPGADPATQAISFPISTAGGNWYGFNANTYNLSDVNPHTGIASNYDLANKGAKIESVIKDKIALVGKANSLDSKKENAYEVDIQGPYFAGHSVTATNDPASIKKVAGNLPSIVNALPSQYLVLCATLVIDGSECADDKVAGSSNITDVSNIKTWYVDWEEALQKDQVDRFVQGSRSQGWYWLVKSATRSIVIVTDAIRIKDDALPASKQQIVLLSSDLLNNFSNTSAGTAKDAFDRPSTSQYVAINASGPKASLITMTVNGVNEDAMESGQVLGIGKHVDSATADFEMAPGTNIVISAEISTVDGNRPEKIFLDLSDLYPPHFAESVRRVIPTTAYVTSQGRVYVEWSRLAYYVNNPAGVGHNVIANGKLVADPTLTLSSYDPTGKVGIIKDATQLLWDDRSNWLKDAESVDTGVAKFNGYQPSDIVPLLSGLPYIQVQRSAVAKEIATVTVLVEDPKSLYPETPALSTTFTVDTKSPKATWRYNVTKRTLEPKTGEIDTSYRRNGFPIARLLQSRSGNGIEIPNRVRSGDELNIVATIQNSSINDATDDAFKDLRTGSIFSIANESLLEVTANLTGFNPAYTDESAELNWLQSLSVTRVTGKPSIITATYGVKVSDKVGTSFATSDDPVVPVITLMDDAANSTVNNSFNKLNGSTVSDLVSSPKYSPNLTYVGLPASYDKNGQWLTPKIAVDNIGPIVTSRIEVVLLGGSAYDVNKKAYVPGAKLPDGAIIAPGALLGVTVTVSDSVDHPQDLVTNKNYGSMTLQPINIDIPAGNIILNSTKANLSGPDDVQVPFEVKIPAESQGTSTDSFKFIMEASDTIGNSSNATSTNSYKFDGKPRLQVFAGSSEIKLPTSPTIYAGNGPVSFEASAFDVGGIYAVQWNVPVSTGVATITAVTDQSSSLGIEAPFVALNNYNNYADLFLTIDPIVLPYGSPVVASSIVLGASTSDAANTVEIPGIVTVNINQPALFAEFFEYVTDSIPDGTDTVALAQGLNVAGQDVREVTVTEGEILSVILEAKDVMNDIVTITASGIDIPTTTPRLASIILGDKVAVDGVASTQLEGTTVELEIVPGYLAVTESAKSATYTIDLFATDSKPAINTVKDYARLIVNVVAKSAKPAVIAQTVTLDGVSVADPSAAQVTVKEGSTLVIVTQVADAGGEELTFTPSASDSHIVFTSDKSFAVEASGQSVMTVTVAYTPGFFDASILEVGRIYAWDPFTFNFAFANSSVTTDVKKIVDIDNVSQPPMASAKYSVNGSPFAALEDNGTIGAVNAGSTVVVEYLATDPDGKLVYFPAGTKGVSLSTNYAMEESARDTNPPDATVTVTIHAPAKVDDTNNAAVLTIVSTDADGSSTTTNYNLLVKPNVIARVDEVVFSAGLGGKTTVQTRNFDKNNGALFSIINSFYGMPPTFLPVAGGGDGRATFVSIGDVDGDNQPEDVISFSAATVADATFPNVLYVRDAVTKQVLEGSAIDPFIGVLNPAAAAYYRNGEIKTAVGNFIGTSKEQVVAVQGIGGNQVLRLLLWDGSTWGIKAQFNALEDSVNGVTNEARAKNLNGQVNVIAADFNGDGIDELVAGQGNSASSETYVQVVEFTQTAGVGMAGVANRIEFKAFDGDFLGQGGVTLAAADINGDGTPELVISSTAGDGGTVTFFKPNVDADGKLASFTRMGPDRSIQSSLFTSARNPSGVLNIAAGEFDGKIINGDELVVATGSLVASDGITSVSAAPVNLFRIIKISSEGDAITSFVTAVKVNMGSYDANLGQAAGWSALQEAFAPTSGALNVAVSDLVTPTVQ